AIHGVVPFMLLLAVCYFTPYFLGGGHGLVVGFGQYLPSLLGLLGFFVICFIFSLISFGSGLPGGIFLPFLSLGAVFGSRALRRALHLSTRLARLSSCTLHDARQASR
ncbi:hypothetical protein B4Q13_23715, partial [Lacticaseibacillus rhamnosus]